MMIHQQNQTLDTINRWALTNGLVTHPLPTTWQIRPLDTFTHGSYPLEHAGWHTIELPSHWQQHPDLRQHTGKVAYACRFAAPPLAAPATRAWLRFNGVFYQAHPYLNGRDLGRHEGYFAPFEYEVTDTLHAENTLLVEVDCPEEHNKLGKRMITGVFSHWDCIDPTSNPGGIWLPVDLHYSGPTRMLGARCHTDTLDDQIADLMRLSNPTVGLAAHSGQTDIRMTARAASEAGSRCPARARSRLTCGRGWASTSTA
ncbi:MAG: hypothetical protein HC828_19655, partial [Blastochloris sp.]|nr:hypothetical protein [Blastochloris sp.]